MPRAFGGTNDSDNLATLCSKCHKERDVTAGTRKGAGDYKRSNPPILFNLSPIALQRLNELAASWGGNQSMVLEIAIDRMYRQDIGNHRQANRRDEP